MFHEPSDRGRERGVKFVLFMEHTSLLYGYFQFQFFDITKLTNMDKDDVKGC